MSARPAGPSFLLAVALALSGLQSNQGKTEGDDREQSVVQQSALRDQLLPSGDGKPCIGKPPNIGSTKLIQADAALSPGERSRAETAFVAAVGLSAHCCCGSGGGRAPPAAI
jgi:hypothetical protein